jgi:phytoene desaturase
MALSFHPLFVGGNPFRVTAVYSMIAFLEREFGVHCAIGGTGAIVKAMVNLIEGQGGEVRCGADVAEITSSKGRATGVRLKDGEWVAGDIVVSNACTAETYANLLPGGGKRRWTRAKLARARYSMSLVVWYFGTSRKFPDVPHHTILMAPRYKDLLTDIFDRKILADDMSLYLHRPTATDPSLAPAGCDCFYVLSPVPNQDSGLDWPAIAGSYRASMARRISETLMPGFEQHILTQRLVTPDDFEHRLQSYKGAAFGMEPTLLQSAWFRPHNKSEELENLFLVGASTHPGAGIPGVLSTARVLDAVVPPAGVFRHAAR